MVGSEAVSFVAWLAARAAEQRREEQNRILRFMMVGGEIKIRIWAARPPLLRFGATRQRRPAKD